MAFTIQKDPITNKDILTRYMGSDAVVVIPDGVYRIGKNAFLVAINIQSVIIPRGVAVIDEQAFYSCTGLKTVSLPEGLLFIGAKAFGICTGLTDIHIPDSVEFIGEGAFSSCRALQHIRLSQNSNCVIEDGAFESANIAELTIPGGIQTIPRSCFANCYNLKRVTIIDGVKRISYAAFDNCRKLSDIEIPPSVEAIEGMVFRYLIDSLKLKVTIHGVPGSEAERYAKSNQFPFVPTSPQSGNSATKAGVRAAGASVKQDITKPVPAPPSASGPPKPAAAANQYEQRVTELKKRYAGKPVPSTLQQFRAENKDIDFAGFSDWVREAHRSTPAKFLTEQGLMARATAAKIPEAKKEETAPRDPTLAAVYGRWEEAYREYKKNNSPAITDKIAKLSKELVTYPKVIDFSGKHFAMSMFDFEEGPNDIAVRMLKLGAIVHSRVSSTIDYYVEDKFSDLSEMNAVIQLRKKGHDIPILYKPALAQYVARQSLEPFEKESAQLRRARLAEVESIQVKGRKFIFACEQNTGAIEVEIERLGGEVLKPYMKNYQIADYVVIHPLGGNDKVYARAMQYEKRYLFRMLNVFDLRNKLSDDPGYRLSCEWDSLSDPDAGNPKANPGRVAPRYRSKEEYIRAIAIQPQELEIGGKRFYWAWNRDTYEQDRKYPAILTMLGGVIEGNSIQEADYFVCDLRNIDYLAGVAMYIRQLNSSFQFILAQWIMPYLDRFDTEAIRVNLGNAVLRASIEPEEISFKNMRMVCLARGDTGRILEGIPLIGGNFTTANDTGSLTYVVLDSFDAFDRAEVAQYAQKAASGAYRFVLFYKLSSYLYRRICDEAKTAGASKHKSAIASFNGLVLALPQSAFEDLRGMLDEKTYQQYMEYVSVLTGHGGDSLGRGRTESELTENGALSISPEDMPKALAVLMRTFLLYLVHRTVSNSVHTNEIDDDSYGYMMDYLEDSDQYKRDKLSPPEVASRLMLLLEGNKGLVKAVAAICGSAGAENIASVTYKSYRSYIQSEKALSDAIEDILKPKRSPTEAYLRKWGGVS